ncbi:MAG TPA: PmeII family type II restriction endonuclease [Bacteroidales bacterium]|nr:PmeII family type II restriction endonuclease [Bacteroidales bacterium]HPI86323.1 PmeII family type II restriction endonuclease [Bacteroidales bacterium]HPM93298.1 PmeII family type II restriction endonuclease [Bacteroidales bacterium]
MSKLNLNEVTQFVEKNIGSFHQSRIEKLNTIKLKEVIRHKNPYLFKAKNVTTAQDIVKGILDAFLSSSEEGIFGNWLERLAIYINDQVYHGRKAGIEGIDLDFDKGGNRYLVSIKSGPHWGNSSQVKKMIIEFDTARKRLATSGNKSIIVCVNGCCYGRSNSKSEYKTSGNYFKICGQRFWELISNDPDLYVKIIEPLGFEAEKMNQEFSLLYSQVINRLTKEFLIDFCYDDGSINWEKLVAFNSGVA